MAVLAAPFFLQFVDNDGVPVSGGKVYTYAAGTTTPKATFTDFTEAHQATNPLILDAAGRVTIWISGAYKFVLTDANDVPIRTTDNVVSFSTPANSAAPFFQSFSGDGTNTNFTLSQNMGTDNLSLMVFVDRGGGKGYDILSPSQYSLNGTSLVIPVAPQAGTNNVYVFAPSTLLNAASAAAQAAATSEANAAASAAAALISEGNASTSASTASTQAGIATTQAGNAATSAGNAATSAGNAATSETNAGNSATTATTQAGIATTQAGNASTSAGNAATSAGNAATSETNAGNSASAASTSAGNAATSETNAAASALAAAASAAQLSGTSVTSIAIGTGTKAFTTQSGKLFNGENVRVYSAANVANYMDGLATYSGTSLSVDVTAIGGAGTFTDWVIKVNGARGEQGPSGSVADGDKGDITVSAGGTVWTIDNTAVTFAKMQNLTANTVLARAANSTGVVSAVALAASRLLGRGSTGDIAAITPGADLLMSGATLSTDTPTIRQIPQVSQSAAYTLVLSDQNKHILHPSADTTARIFTIPANASVAFPIGTAVTFVNQNGAGVITIAITTDTMRLAGAGTTGSRTLAANGVATALKITSTEWIISGTGLS